MRERIINNKRIFIDFATNILASGIMTIVLQIFVYPFLAKSMTFYEYGIVLTIMGIENTIVNSIGNGINNTRLVKNVCYEENENEDFNYLLIIGSCISLAIFGGLYYFIFKREVVEILLLCIAGFLGIYRLYYCAAFRIRINFKKMLYCNSTIAVGYVLGIVLFILGFPWPSIFIIGELSGILYLSFNSFLFSFGIKKTKKFNATAKTYIYLALSTAVASAVTYLDRILILPILGSDSVAIYSTASIVGKTLGMLMIPIGGVLLGYYSQKGFVMGNRLFCLTSLLFSVVCILFFCGTLIIGKTVLRLLYPSLFEEAGKYMNLANFAAVVSVLANMISPAILRFVKSYWQIIVSVLYATIYCVLGYYWSLNSGLQGFCYASICAGIIRVGLLWGLGMIFIKK